MTTAVDSLRPALLAILEQLRLPAPKSKADALLGYVELLLKWNSRYNLTAVREPGEMLKQHFADCLAVIEPLQRQVGRSPRRLLDVGSGGGFPGAVIAIMCPAIDVTCVDSVGKKSAFIQQAASELKLNNLHARHARIEQLQALGFDVVTSRAFASLADFTASTTQLLAKDGIWMAMKGKVPDNELTALPNSIEVFHVEQLSVPSLAAARCLVWMRQGPRVA